MFQPLGGRETARESVTAQAEARPAMRTAGGPLSDATAVRAARPTWEGIVYTVRFNAAAPKGRIGGLQPSPAAPTMRRMNRADSFNPKRRVTVRVYGRAIMAGVLPAALLAASRSIHFDALLSAMHETATERLGLPWLMFAILGAVLLLEWHYLATLGRLLLARGRIERYIARAQDPVRRTRRRRRRFRIAAVLLSVGFAFLTAEAGFRALDLRPPSPAPNPFQEHKKFDNTLNAMGIREKWDSLPDDDPRVRVAFLGDSIVYGYNVQPHESFCQMAASMLNAWLSDASAEQKPPRQVGFTNEDFRGRTCANPHGVVTINMGFPGTAPGRQLPRFLPVRDALRPDVVVHVVYPNDLDIDPYFRLKDIYRLRDNALWLGERSFVLRYAERQVRYWLAWKRTIDYFRGGHTRSERDGAWAKFKDDVRACKAAVEEAGARYVLVLFPVLIRLDDYPLADVHAAMRRFAGELSVPYLDLLSAFAGHNADDLRATLGDEHPNAFGHRLAAERIADFLRTEVLARCPNAQS